jgi:hypothetical protein
VRGGGQAVDQLIDVEQDPAAFISFGVLIVITHEISGTEPTYRD